MRISRWHIPVTLGLPLASGSLAALWGWVFGLAFVPSRQITIGIFPWLELDGSDWRIIPLGLAAMTAITACAFWLFWRVLRWSLTLCAVGARCEKCGYPIVSSGARCPECGESYSKANPEPIWLTPIHRPLILVFFLLWTVPGIVTWFMMVEWWLIAGWGTRYALDSRVTMGAAVAILVSGMAGVLTLWRYKRAYADS
jgi:hypothetical protein